MSLTQQLADIKAQSTNRIPEDAQKVMAAELQNLTQSGLVERAPKVGEILPDFALPNHKGETSTLEDLRKQGPVIIAFYRGGWCPYCNIELQAYQQSLGKFKDAGATLVAITPELPDESLSTQEKNGLEFEVLTDTGSEYARGINIVFTLPETLRPIYESFGIQVEKHNGKGQFDLPLAATFVVAQDGTLTYAFVTADYTKRADPQDILNALQAPV